MTNGFQIKKC